MSPVLPSTLSATRIVTANRAEIRSDGDYVLYWMTSARRLHYNAALQRAVEWAAALDKGLVIFEALRCDYRWSSARHHSFVLQGMAEQQRSLATGPVRYLPFVESELGAGRGLLAALAQRACLIVADDSPAFFYPRMLASAAKQVGVLMERVDGNGLMPLRVREQAFPTAYAFRRFLQKALPAELASAPKADPLRAARKLRSAKLPATIRKRWAPASSALLRAEARALAELPLAQSVPPVPDIRGGHAAARKRLKTFLKDELGREPKSGESLTPMAGSGLSPWLHFGQISSHEVLAELARTESWIPAQLEVGGRGARAGWWKMSSAAESFLDELVTWRELGHHFCQHTKHPTRYSSLPEWARTTLEEHSQDPRPKLHSLAELDRAATDDPVWNLAQRQLLEYGRIHNYLRMLWGKRVLEWTPTPQRALQVLFHLNDKYALDGRDPNSMTGITWTLGRFDRPWGPERPIFGKIRYMSSKRTAQKLKLKFD